ncbi:hypothetical protein UFOVP1299_59 [uncultured Caudovirales phage]|uniref:Uncharacterized protein n=1 Tax=uncultured Caudovirales phage TaxID=2100421 RepID=A0A6J5RPF3_9CAUD|nr:hypothetical protein UFOVP1299_59 [uncultured Caudovirales phage]
MSKVFFGGLPTDAEVKALLALYGAVTPGTFISHEDIAALTNTKVKSSRYLTIVMVWRKRLLNDHAIVLKSIRGKGYVSLSDVEKIDAATDKFATGTRTHQRAIIIGSAADREQLDSVTAAKHDHLMRLGALTINSGRELTSAVARLGKPVAQ